MLTTEFWSARWQQAPVAQWTRRAIAEEQRASNATGEGSIPSGGTTPGCSSGVEQRPYKPQVDGASPSSPTSRRGAIGSAAGFYPEGWRFESSRRHQALVAHLVEQRFCNPPSGVRVVARAPPTPLTPTAPPLTVSPCQRTRPRRWPGATASRATTSGGHGRQVALPSAPVANPI